MVVAFGVGLFWPPSDGVPTHVRVAVTPDYAGAEMLEDTNYQQLAGGRGRFPADPAPARADGA